ncbi:MAG TPA: YicC/YloC family endoribonuclease [Terriglobales bacterium]|nr:YicC/YloC family endoribonuclease [Terriglobales bacterium]
MRSMTGYGEGAKTWRGARIAVQVRSLNHRHLDLQLRGPREYLAFEEDIRKTLRGKIGRGRIELFINRSSTSGGGKRLDLDDELMGQYLRAIERAKKKFHLTGEVEIVWIAKFPDLFRIRDSEVDVKKERDALFQALSSALQQLERSRVREGRQLMRDMVSQVGHLKRISRKLKNQAAEHRPRLQKTALASNGENLAQGSEDSSGASNWVLKGDVNEEVVRLQSHITALGGVMRESQPVGKKIDFILQEVQRELNTISSKLPHFPVVQLVLQGKERVEKIREQTQNIE